MNKRLHILHLEDDPDFSALVRDLLTQGGVAADLHLVCNQTDFDAALTRGNFDVILADYSLPDWTGVQALDVARDRAPQTPFLLVSGTIGEHAAIESLRAGATDYVLKQTPERLVPAVQRAVREAEERLRRKRAETELVRREKYFRALTYNSLDILSVLNPEGVLQYNSPSLKRVAGYDPQAVAGRSFFEFVHPDEAGRVQQAFRQGLQNPDSTVTLSFRFRHAAGHWVDLEAVGQSRLNDPDVNAVIVTSRDVTERKRTERQREALASLGHRLSSVSEPKDAARIIKTVADELFGWDAFMLDLYVTETDDVLPLLNVDTIAGMRKEYSSTNATQKPSGMARRVLEQGAELILHPNPVRMLSDSIPVGDTSRPSASLILAPVRHGGKSIGVLSVQSYTINAYTRSDLDMLQALADHCGGALERIRADQALRESEQRFRDLFAGSPDAIFVEDLNGYVLDVNVAACLLHGVARDQLIGKNVGELVPPERRRDALANFQKLADGWLSRVEGESLSADGRITPIEVRASRIQFNGAPAVLQHVRDISDHKDAETALRSSETLFRSVWENSVDGMRLTDENGTIIAVNKSYCNLVGMERHGLEGKFFTAVYADAEQPGMMLQAYRQRFRDHTIERQVERRLTLRNGTVVIFENTNSFVELRGQSPLLLGLFRDVSAQKRLEEQLRQSQKMDAIGKLAGGVAHDFNNILTVIHGHASLLLATGTLPERSTKSAQQIIHAADRAAGLTRQLLTFSSRQVMQPRRLDVNDVVGNMTKLLDRILGEDITLQVDNSPAPATVQADASMLEQVVLNLAVNARDAMPRGGQLHISITMVDVDAQHVLTRPEARPGRFVCLTVSDTGCGISPENLPRIFEPFFTTKQVGKGTGLGLATVYGVARQHQGWVEVDSELDRGTTFRCFVPSVAAPVGTSESKPAETAPRGGTETILVVEDELPVRELVCAILQGHGYHILQAESGVKALDVWRGHRDAIDLVLTDVVMPDRMNGWELAETLLADRPELKVIFTSGYSDDVVGREFVMQQGSRFLQKPYDPQKLAATVRKCLDSQTQTVTR